MGSTTASFNATANVVEIQNLGPDGSVELRTWVFTGTSWSTGVRWSRLSYDNGQPITGMESDWVGGSLNGVACWSHSSYTVSYPSRSVLRDPSSGCDIAGRPAVPAAFNESPLQGTSQLAALMNQANSVRSVDLHGIPAWAFRERAAPTIEIWLAKANDEPLQVIGPSGSSATVETTTYAYLPLTPKNIALATLPIPKGFSQTTVVAA